MQTFQQAWVELQDYFSPTFVSIGLAVVYLVVLYIGYKVCSTLLAKLHAFLTRCDGSYIRSIRFRNLELVSSSYVIKLLHHVSNFIVWLLFVVGMVLAALRLIALHPPLQPVSNLLIHAIIDPLAALIKSVIHYLPDFFTALFIVFLSIQLIRLLRFIKISIQNGKLTLPGFHKEWADTTFHILRFVLIVFTLIIIFPYLPGSSSPAFKGVTVFLGILLSFGSSGTMANIISGIILTYMRPFKKGDRVKIQDAEGFVLEKNSLVTRLRSIRNEEIILPNSTIMNSSIINYTSLDAPLALTVPVTIGYEIPWRQVHSLLLQAAQESAYKHPEAQHYVLQKALDDNYVTYQLYFYTRERHDLEAVHTDLHQHIQDLFAAHRIELVSPTYHNLRQVRPSMFE